MGSGLKCKSAIAILSKYTSPKNIIKANTYSIANTLKLASRGKFKEQHATDLKALAKNTIAIDNPAMCLQVKYLIKQIDLLTEQISSIEDEIKIIMDELNSTILTIPDTDYVLGSMIISEIGDVSKFSSPAKLLAYAGLDPSIKQISNKIKHNLVKD